MKTNRFFFVTAITLSAILSCSKEIAPETDAPEASEATEALASGRNFQTLVAAPAEGAVDVDSKTAFVGGTFMWKLNNNIVVRSNNANGFTTFTYSGADTAGEAEFAIRDDDSEDKIVTGNNSFAYYPAKTSGTGATAFPREDEGSLKLVLKDGYTWFDGNVEAPMLAKVTDDGTALQFKHLGGVLKVTYKYLPPKAAKLVISAPASEAGQYYKICDVQKSLVNWETAAGGFTGETPYLQAYAVTGKKEITQNIAAATAAQRASDDGVTVYIPLPVGPGDAHTYPEIDIRLTFADGTTVPGSERVAKNVKIERATIKKMRPITLTKYTVETLISSIARTPHDIIRRTDDEFIVTGEQYHVYFLDVNNKTATQSATNSASKYPASPYGVCYSGDNLYIANKVATTGNAIYKYDLSTKIYSIVTGCTGYNNPMQIKEHNGSIYLLCRGDGSAAGKIYVFPNGLPGEVPSEVYADFSGIASSGYAWPLSFAFDTDGSMVVAVSASSGSPSECFKLYKVTSKGAAPVAMFGSGTKSGNYDAIADGVSANASFAPDIQDMEFDSAGNLYIADQYCLRKLVRGTTGFEDGTIVTLTASGVLPRVDGLAFDSSYSHIYVSDKSNKRIYKVTIE